MMLLNLSYLIFGCVFLLIRKTDKIPIVMGLYCSGGIQSGRLQQPHFYNYGCYSNINFIVLFFRMSVLSRSTRVFKP
jgi:hypothetical protein